MICDMCKHRCFQGIESREAEINGVKIEGLVVSFEVYVCKLGKDPRRIGGDVYLCRWHEYKW